MLTVGYYFLQKLRLVFAENELPERALRVSLSKQLGLEFEKVMPCYIWKDLDLNK